MDLRLRWPWFEWTEPARAWIGLGHPCDKVYIELFYNSINVVIGEDRQILALTTGRWAQDKGYCSVHFCHLQA